MPTPLDRTSPDAARAILSRLFGEPGQLQSARELLRAGIEAAHSQNGASWGVTLSPRSLALNVGSGSILRFEKGTVCFASEQTAPDAVEPERVRAAARSAAEAFASARIANPSWRAAHSPGVLEMLREEGVVLPDPSYAEGLRAVAPAPHDFSLRDALENLALSAGLQLPTDHLAAFYTALQTKGFVLLSGPSGTGKTRLALAFAHALHDQTEPATITPGPGFAATGQIVLPRALRGNDGAVGIVCEGKSFRARQRGALLTLRGAARKWVRSRLQDGEQTGKIVVESEWDENGPLLRLLPVPDLSRGQQALRSSHESRGAARTLFLPVRPDWSDPKALLGYYNPLLSRYEWTPLLRFLLRAEHAFAAGDDAPFFVVMDEVNLARVEHYFADFLAVFEAGRDTRGRAREPLRFEFDPQASGDLPPRELHLTPNVYFVGTLNDDETTWPLSPRVRDRAWLLPAPRADFSTYHPGQIRENRLSDFEARELSRRFTRGGRFVGFDKSFIATELERQPQWRDWLHELHEKLGPHGFGFRVFDEMVAFCGLARQNAAFESLQNAFDFAACAKIVARFDVNSFSSRAPLETLREWAKQHELMRTVRAVGEKFDSADF